MGKNKHVSGRVNRRKEILRAAEKLMLSHGLSGVTTRQISREAGCSEGALYVHFNGRLDLLLAMLEEGLPKMLGPLQILQRRIGRGSAQSNLVVALTGIYLFHQRVTPLAAGLFAEPALLAAYRASLAREGKGPHLSMKVLQRYIAAEQRLERIDQRVDPELAAYLLMSASFFRAFSEQSFSGHMKPTWRKLVRQLIATIVPAVDTK